MKRKLSNTAIGKPLFSDEHKLELSLPDEFPDIQRLIEVILTENYRRGILFAYLRRELGETPLYLKKWRFRCLGPAAGATNTVLRQIPNNPAWIDMVKERYFWSPLEAHQLLLLAWLTGDVKPELTYGYPKLQEAVDEKTLPLLKRQAW